MAGGGGNYLKRHVTNDPLLLVLVPHGISPTEVMLPEPQILSLRSRGGLRLFNLGEGGGSDSWTLGL